MTRIQAFYLNRNASATKKGPGRYHEQGMKKPSPVASKGGPLLLQKEPKLAKTYKPMAVSSLAEIAAHNAKVGSRQVLRAIARAAL